MSICAKLKTYLDDQHIRYVVTTHSPAFTSQEIAARAHIPGKQLVKCVMVNGDGRHYMVAMTANQKLNLDWLKGALGLRTVRLENEEDFRPLFADCEVGAMPPFGNLYGIPVVVDAELYEDDEIAFNGGNHTSVVRMSFDDFDRLVQPRKAVVALPQRGRRAVANA
jgi:Ala-tRNA(Pro) deacylase